MSPSASSSSSKLDAVRIETLQVHQGEAGRVPDLVAEVAVAGDPLLGQLDVPPLGGEGGQGEAEGVGAVLVDDRQRVDDVPLGLGHLLPLGVAHQGVDVDVA